MGGGSGVVNRLAGDLRDEIIQITRHGIRQRLSQPGIREDSEQTRRDIAESNTASGDDCAAFGLPPR
ncbi:hypothetical protein DQ354_18510 [Arthrobacter sp. AQ5-06]|nr:hypothetical protein DQ354_18510 [Arthrobacter sp. AQ5-06]